MDPPPPPPAQSDAKYPVFVKATSNQRRSRMHGDSEPCSRTLSRLQKGRQAAVRARDCRLPFRSYLRPTTSFSRRAPSAALCSGIAGNGQLLSNLEGLGTEFSCFRYRSRVWDFKLDQHYHPLKPMMLISGQLRNASF